MSNKRARRAAREATVTPAPAPTRPIRSSIAARGPRVLVSGGMMTVASLVTAVSAFLPWVTIAGRPQRSGLEILPGILTLVLGLVVAGLGSFILFRPDHRRARAAAWAGLVVVLAIGAVGVITVATVGTYGDAKVAPGVLLAIAGGMVATMGIRGLLERR